MKNFNPVTILGDNVSSNDGLEKIYCNNFRRTIDQERFYNFFVMDINIYYRTLRLIFNQRTKLNFLSKTFIPILGLWHPFKMVCEKIQQYFTYTIFAPLFHTLFPESTMLKKMRVRKCQDKNYLICSVFSNPLYA